MAATFHAKTVFCLTGGKCQGDQCTAGTKLAKHGRTKNQLHPFISLAVTVVSSEMRAEIYKDVLLKCCDMKGSLTHLVSSCITINSSIEDDNKSCLRARKVVWWHKTGQAQPISLRYIVYFKSKYKNFLDILESSYYHRIFCCRLSKRE